MLITSIIFHAYEDRRTLSADCSLTMFVHIIQGELLVMAHIYMKNQHMILNNGDNQEHIQINRSLIITKQATIKSQQK